MITRRIFVAGLGGGLFALAGCGRRPPAPDAAPTVPVTTVTDPAAAAAATQLTAHPLRFTDVSRPAGLTWAFTNGGTGRHLFIESTGGGVALFDYDGDGLLDIFAVQGGPVPGATGAERSFSTRSALYRNNGDGTFTDVTERAGLGADLGYGQGVSVADYDNDGRPDLYVTCLRRQPALPQQRRRHVHRRHPPGRARRHGHGPGRAALAPVAAWGDYDNDGHLDLFVCHYARWSPALDQTCQGPDGKPAYCRPQVYEPSHSRPVPQQRGRDVHRRHPSGRR